MRRLLMFVTLIVSLVAFGPSAMGAFGTQGRRQPPTKDGESSPPATEKAKPRPPATEKAEPRPPEAGKAEPRRPDTGKGESRPEQRRAEDRDRERRGSQPRPSVRPGSVVFVGGYFYDPFFDEYPWWPRGVYPRWYYPALQNRAIVRIMATPTDAAVYVDGFYAGSVDDFDGFFQGLPLPPGGHQITLYLDGFRTVHRRIYLAPGGTFRLREDLERLPYGLVSEPPVVSSPIPPPPEGSYLPPRTLPPPASPPVPAPDLSSTCPMGTLTLRIQPASADVWIDGERWVSSDGGSFVIEVPSGTHRIQVRGNGYREYSGNIDVRDGETTQLDITLARDHS